MLVIVTTVLFLMSMPLPEASRVLPNGEKQNMMKNNQFFGSLQVQGDQVLPPISVAPKPNPPTTPPSTTWQKAFASDHNKVSPLLRRQLLRGFVTPSAPNPGTLIPATTTGHKAAPMPGSLNKSAPPPSMPNGHTSNP